MLKKQLESSIQSKILKWLKAEYPDAYVRKIIASNVPTVDVHLCLDGWFIAFEIKKPGQKPTALQEHNLNLVLKAGGRAFWVDNLEELKLRIESIKLIINKEA